MPQVLASSKSKRSANSGAPSSHLSKGTGSVCLAGTFTLEPLESALSLLAKTVALSPSLVFAPYNQVFQELLSPSSNLRTNGGGLNVLLIRPEDWLRFWEPGQQSVSQEQFVLQNATQLVEALTSAAASGSVPYLVLFPPANESPAFCLDAREKLRSDLAKIPNVTIGDVSFTSDDLAFFDAESDAQGHIPYSPTGFAALAATITRQLYSLSNPPHKVLVLDADFTLWDGVCAEGAVHIKQEHHALQEYALQQKRAGVLLAVCSKNIEADVRRTFSTTSGMLLTEQDIVSWKINWKTKSENLKALASELDLGLDSFVFIDDNPAEVAEVRAACPSVLTLQLPEGAAVTPFLRAIWAFDKSGTMTDRTELYRQQAARLTAAESAATFADFIEGLELKITEVTPTADQHERIAELTQRTNQFNTTGRRLNTSDVRTALQSSDASVTLLRVADRFGDYGIVGLAMAERKGDIFELGNLLLSCRALGKGVEHSLLAKVGEKAVAAGCNTVRILFTPTERNEPASRFLESFATPYRESDGTYCIPAQTVAALRFDPNTTAVTSNESNKSASSISSSRFTSAASLAVIAEELNNPAAIAQAVAKASLRERAIGASFEEPQTATEKAVAAIWEEVLNVHPVGVTDRFTELGGTSILATRIASRVHAQLSIRVHLGTLFQFATVRNFAAHLDTLEATAKLPPLTQSVAEAALVLSPAQERIWFLDEFNPGLPTYNIPVAFRLPKSADVQLLEQALNVIARRHVVLRTTFPAIDGRAVPVVATEPSIAIQTKTAHNADEALAMAAAEAKKPFDLAKGPVLRATCVTAQDSDSILVLNLHHIVADGWSLALFLRELSESYAALSESREPSLPELPVQYHDFAAWRRSLDAAPAAFTADLAYWKAKLAGAPAQLDLPTDFHRPPVVTYTGDVRRHQIGASLTKRLTALAEAHGCTLLAVLIAAYQTLHHRYSGQEDIVVGTPISGRTHPAIENLIGCFINTLPLRGQPESQKTFSTLLAETRLTVHEAFAHEALPFEKLVDELGLARDLSHTPLFQVMFVLQNAGDIALNLPEGSAERLPIHSASAKFDQVFEATPNADGTLSLVLEFNTDLFAGDTVERQLGHFENLLRAVTEHPEMSLGQLPLLSDDERQSLTSALSASSRAFPSEDTLHLRFEAQAALHPNSIAASCDGQSLSFAQLNAKANQLAHFLRSNGVLPDSLVGVCTERSLDLLVALLGILKAGAGYLPIDLAYPADRLAFMLEDAKAPFLLTQSHLLKDLPEHSAQVLCLDDPSLPLWSGPSSNPPHVSNADHLAYVIYTSGSTGKPKGVQITHRNVIRLFDSTHDWFRFSDQDVWSLFHSYAFDFSVWEIWGALLYGGRVVVVPFATSRSPQEFYKLLADEKVTVLNQTPSAFKQLSAAEDMSTPRDLALRLVIFGGEALEMQSLKPWFDRHGDTTPQLVNMYGITETTVHVTYRPLSKDDLTRGSVIGVPLPDLQLYILDAHLEPVPLGVPGEIFVGGAGLARGYLHRPELTAERFIAHPFSTDINARLYRTGDLARRLSNGDIEYLGRIDHQVQLRGFRVELGEIESVLATHPKIREARVLMREDTPGDQRLAAYLIPSNGSLPGVSDLREHLRKKLPDYMVPAAFITLEKFPLTNNGKLDTKALPAPTTDRTALASSFIAPQSDTEKTLAKIWQDVLKVQRIGSSDNFFELGGDSILSIQIIARARAAGLDLMPKHLFKNQTIAELAAVCAEPTAPAKAVSKTVNTKDIPLTPIERWFLDHRFENANHWTQSFLFETTQPIDSGRLHEALAVLVKHHSALRLRIKGHVQSVADAETSELLEVISGTSIDTHTPQTQLNIEHGPLLRAVLYPDAHRLFITIHHLAVDGVSWRILLEDLEAAYHGRTLTSATAPFATWAEALREFANSPRLVGEASYWRSVGLHAPEGPSLPHDAEVSGPNIESSVQQLTLSLTETETQALLREVPSTFGTRINAALLTALSSAFRSRTGSRSLFLELEGHGREHVVGDIDTTRSVGWFTSIYPVSIRLPSSEDLVDALKSVQGQLEVIPNNGVGYGVLRYLSAEDLGENRTPDLVFNHLGQFDQVTADLELLRFAPEPVAAWHGGKNHRTHALEINTIVVGGKLEVRVFFSTNLHRTETVGALADAFVAKLRELIAHAKPQAVKGEAGTLPLSPMQHLFYTLGTSKPEYPFDQWHARLEGPLDVAAFQEAWLQVINRHSILRSTFNVDSTQTVHTHVVPDWTIKEGTEADIAALLVTDRQQHNDLRKAALSRFQLLRLSDHDHFFLWSLPDLQMDGWSWPVLFREVSQTYAALVQGKPVSLPSARPYSDYLDWLSKHDDSASLAFWKQNLAGFKKPTPLPLDRAAQRGKSRRLAEQTLAISSADTATLKANARQRRVTPGVVVQAAWAALLGRCADTQDVVFGAAFSGRPADLPDAGSIVGPFTTNLPVRVDVDPASKASDFIVAVQEQLFELNTHQFSAPLEIQDASEVAWKNRLFDSLVVFQNYEVSDEATRLGETVQIRDFEGPVHTNFDLTLIAVPGDELRFTLLHDENRCSPERASAMLRDLASIIIGLLKKPEATLAEIQSVVTVPAATVQEAPRTASTNFVSPTTDLQKKIASVWQKAFGLERVGIDDNFFELGGHSLLLVRVHAKLRELLKREFPIVTLFQHPTVAALASHLDDKPAVEIKSTSSPAKATTDIAIVGMAIRAPGAQTLDEFWQNLTAGKETITTFAKEDIATGEPVDDHEYIPRRGVIKDATFLDARFFGINPKEAEVTDPQQRLFLEASHEALEAAGVDPHQWPGVIGVYAGMGQNYYYLNNVHHNRELRELVGAEAVMLGNEKDYIATRVAYKLDLTGPALNIHTACSTSLVAVCQAARAIMDGECDMALAGGAAIRFPQERGYLYEEGSIFSSDGHCRAFDASAAGTVFSNGLGVVVLKRLDDAQRDGDSIYAVIKGVGLNNDGARKVSFTAPSVDGQAGAIEKAIRMAGISPDTISYVEAHGTGTPLGDPIEVAGLSKAFRALGSDRTGFCGLGSLKTSTGHMDAAAGVCGLIKTALALHHKQIPATLHYQRPNPKLGLEDSPFRVIDRLTEWNVPDGMPRRAGVSALGVGGTNAHVVLEEAPPIVASPAESSQQLIVLSARTETALATARTNLADYLESHPQTNIADAAFTLQVGRQSHAHRAAFVASSTSAAIELLRGKLSAQHQTARDLPVAMLFPGQGAQYPGMGRGLYESEQVYRETVDHCAEVLSPVIGCDLRDLLYPAAEKESEARELLKETRFTQPAIFVTSYAMAQMWRAWGIAPSAMLGHSVGEYVAATLAGVFSLEDALVLVAKRAQLVQNLPGGSMLAVRLPEAEVTPLLPDDLDLAALNSKNLTVVAGSFEAIERFEAVLKERGVTAKRLATSHAFHSRMMEPAIEPFKALFTNIRLHAPQTPFVSNVTGRWVNEEETQDPAYWASHIRQSVRFTDGLATLLNGSGAVILEVGPGTTCATFARQHPARDKDRAVVSTITSPEADEQASALDALGKLWLGGVTLDWSKLHASNAGQRRRIPLPTYPFERQNFCAPPAMVAILTPTNTAAPDPSAAREPASAPAPSAVVSRTHHLVTELKAQLHEISGMAAEDLAESATFLDLGFDSLFLTQASLVFKKHFGVKITFRQLMEDLNSIGALATYLDKTLPAGQFAPAVPAAPAPQVAAAPALTNRANASVEERLAYLEAAFAKLMKGEAPVVSQAPSSASMPAAKSSGIKVRNQNSNPNKKIVFGPFRPVEKAEKSSLTTTQDAHLTDLIARYNARTGSSKGYTQKHRRVLADPRAAAGFNPLWKDLVYPLVVDRSEGSKIWDIDGNEYVDITLGFGLSLFGHRPKFVNDAIKAQLDRGIEIGPSHPLAGEVAEMLLEFSGMDRVSFCNTGSEAVTAAIRIARTVTGREKIAMFTGAYHGIFDEVLVRPLVVNGELRSIPIAPGITQAAVQEIIVLEYDNPESLEILREHGHEIAAILVETVQSRRPDLQPVEFIKELRAITKETDTALIFDEVVTGFRVAPGGNQERFGIKADIVTYGKVVGGGLPIGVVAGTRKYMDALDGGFWQYGDDSFPEVGVTFFAGTFIRHPLALAAAKAVLTHLKNEGPALQQNLEARTTKLVADLNAVADRSGVPIKVTQFSSLYFLNFAPELKHVSLLFVHMRMRGIHIWESRGSFISTAHSDDDLQRIVTAFAESIAELQDGGFFPKSLAAHDIATVPSVTSRSNDSTPDKGHQASTASSFPLTGPQEELFLASHLGEGANLACNESVTVRLDGAISIDKLKSALQSLVNRHENLRTTFAADGSVQIVVSSMALDVATHKVSGIAELVQKETTTPFDLTRSPLFRAAIAEVSSTEHYLILTAHHSICDGWSFDLLITDLAAFYNGDQLEAATPFRTYAAAQRDFRQTPEFAENESYWLGQFKTLPDAFELPTDFKRPAVKSYRAGTVRGALTPELSSKLRAYCKANGLTPYAVLLATYHLLLSKLSGQNDIVIGAPIAGQAASGMNNLCGQCVNFLPMRLSLAEGETIVEHLKNTRGLVLDTLEHQDYTLGHITQQLEYQRQASRPQFVNVTFTLEPDGEERRFGEARAHANVSPKSYFGFDHGLFVVDNAEAFKLLAIYSRDLFSEETAQRWLAHFTTLLSNLITSSATQQVSKLSLLTDAERRSLTVSLSTSSRAFPSEDTLHLRFEAQAALHPNAVAASCDGHSLSFSELNAKANQLAHFLRSNGVSPDSLVGVCTERSLDLPVALLGILKAGAGYLPIDLAYPADRLAFMLEDAKAPFLLTQSHLLKDLPEHSAQVLCLDDPSLPLWSGPSSNPPHVSNADHLAYVIYTSGSTGKPKGVQITHRNVIRLFDSTHDWFRFSDQDVWSLFHSYAFDFSVWEIWGALLYGGRVVVVPFATSRSPQEFYKLLADEKVTVLNQTPSAFKQLSAAEDMSTPRDLALRLVIFGGEALEMQSLKPWFDRHDDTTPQLVNMYGITETTVHVTYRPLSKDDLTRGSVIGVPLPDLQLYILDAHLEPVPLGVPGEIFVGGAGLARGYLHRPELTAERFIAHPFSTDINARLYRTGDLARRLSNGDIEYLGRIDHQVQLRGFRVELGEIESVLATHPKIREARVLMREDTPGDQRLAAYLIPSNGSLPGVSDLREHLRKKLPDYMVPAAFITLEKFPLTNNGKLDTKALPAPTTDRTALASSFIAPQSDTEKTLAKIWQDVLKVQRIGSSDNFFELGGHSLLGLALFTRIQKEFGTPLPLATLFQAPTITGLAEIIDANRPHNRKASTEARSFLSLVQAEGSKTPIFCIHGGDGGSLFYGDLARGLPHDRPFYSIEAPALIDRSRSLHDITMESCASQYLVEMKKVQPVGPYLMGGYSFGGVVAWEMAQMLRRNGEEVVAVVLFDTSNPQVEIQNRYTLVDRIKAHWNLNRNKPLPARIGSLAARVAGGIVSKRNHIARVREAERLLQQGADVSDQVRLVQVREAHTRAFESYVPKPLDAPVLLLRANSESDRCHYTDQLGWEGLTPAGITVRTISGTHLEIFKEPHLSVLVKQLAESISTLP